MTIATNVDSPRTATANPPVQPVQGNLGQAAVVRSSAGGPVAGSVFFTVHPPGRE